MQFSINIKFTFELKRRTKKTAETILSDKLRAFALRGELSVHVAFALLIKVLLLDRLTTDVALLLLQAPLDKVID